jgi:outer membrane protein assembly factor BamB
MVSHGVRRIRGLGWAAMLACAVAAAAGAGDVSFPTWRGDFSLAGVVKDRIPDSPSKIWEFKAGAPVPFTPVVGDGKVFFVTAIDLRDASRAKWTTHVGGMSVESPIIARERVVVTVDGAIRLLDLDDGKVLWTSSSLGDTITPPAVAGGMTIVGSDSGAVVAFGAKTGDMK